MLTATCLTLFAVPGLAQRPEGFDPFAAPPKNVKAEDLGQGENLPQGNLNRVYSLETVPGQPEKKVTITPIGKIDDTHYSGILEKSDRLVEGYNTYTLNIGNGQTVPLNTKKDISEFVGAQITIEVERTDTGTILKSISVVEAEEMGGKMLEVVGTEGLHAAPTGPKTWLLVPVVLLILAALFATGSFSKLSALPARFKK